MKHNVKIISIILALFILAQIVGLGVLISYNNSDYSSTITNQDNSFSTFSSIISGFVIAIALFALFMKIKAQYILKIWFSIVIAIALWLSIYSFTNTINYGAILAIVIILPLMYYKIIKRSILIHNLTEVLIYPGIAIIFAPILSIYSLIWLLVLISAYDIYAVWHAKFMQKMAKFQLEKVKIFSGLIIPYRLKKKGKKVSVAILGGGDIVFPIIASGVMFLSLGIIPALLTILGATIGLIVLFIFSEKGKFYPAMPFIAIGIILGMLPYLI